MGRCKFAIDTVKRMGNGMSNFCGLKITLENKDVFASDLNIGVLSLSNPPNQKVYLTRILREISRNLLADKGAR